VVEKEKIKLFRNHNFESYRVSYLRLIDTDENK